MNLLAISISHHTASVELREALHLNKEEIIALLKEMKGTTFTETFIISTCNRTEIYGIPFSSNITVAHVREKLLSFKPVPSVTPEHFRSFVGPQALNHLYKVISGIDSLLIGDNQIYAQVKDSFLIAEQENFAGLLVKRVFDSAIKAGKRSITETAISEGAVTVSFAAVQLIEKIFSNLSKKTALVIGAGETGEIAAKHLRDRAIGKLSISNRTLEKAEKLALQLNAKIVPFEKLPEYLHEFDIIISATSSDKLIIHKNDITAAMKKRDYNSMVIMDIAIPRDVDPAVRDIDYLFYNDIDSLNIIVDLNLSKRKNEIPKVNRIIEQEVNSFLSWYSSLEVAPTIKELREVFEKIRNEEVEKNKNRFSSEDQEKLEIVTKRIINKILHHPTVELKKMNENAVHPDETATRISIIRDMFGMGTNGESEENK